MNLFVHLAFLVACTTATNTLVAQDSTRKVVQVVFTENMDQAALDSIQRSVKTMGVELTINHAEYKAGLLQTIDFSVSSASGKGSARGEIRPDRKFGFQCYPNGGTNYAFVVGRLDPPPDKDK